MINYFFIGANVNIIPSCGRTALGRAAQLGFANIVCLLLDADKFYTTPEEEVDVSCFINYGMIGGKNFLKASRHSNHHENKCCSPSIDSETYIYSDEVSQIFKHRIIFWIKDNLTDYFILGMGAWCKWFKYMSTKWFRI